MSKPGWVVVGVVAALSLACASGDPPPAAPTSAPEAAPVHLSSPPAQSMPAVPALQEPVPLPDPSVAIPLVTGATWTWEIVEYPADRGGLMVFERPTSGAHKLGTWTFAIGEPAEPTGSGEAVFRATLDKRVEDFEPRHSDLTVWNREGALWFSDGGDPQRAFSAKSIPDDALISEPFACQARILSAQGMCVIRGGGPTQAAPGFQRAVLSGPSSSSQMFKAAGFILTGGIIRPGDSAPTVVAVLSSYACEDCPPDPESYPLYDAWDAAGRKRLTRPALKGLLETHDVDLESLGAILQAQPADRVPGLADEAIPFVALEERVRVARLALLVGDAIERLNVLASMPAIAGAPGVEALEVYFSVASQRRTARFILAEPAPVLRAVLLGGPWAEGQAAALRTALKTHPVSEQEAIEIYGTLKFQSGRRPAMKLLRDALPEDSRATVFAGQLGFLMDNQKVKILAEHPDWVAELTDEQKKELLSGFHFDKHQSKATALLDP